MPNRLQGGLTERGAALSKSFTLARPAPCVAGRAGFSHIPDEQMKRIMKAAVDAMYRLLWQQKRDPDAYRRSLALGARYTHQWDDPEIKARNRP